MHKDKEPQFPQILSVSILPDEALRTAEFLSNNPGGSVVIQHPVDFGDGNFGFFDETRS